MNNESHVELDDEEAIQDDRCPSCESEKVTVALVADHFIYGDESDAPKIDVTIPVHTCANCGLQFTDHVAENLRHEALCRHFGLLTPREIRAIRDKYGMTRKQFADVTKIGEATLGRWERGALLQNEAYDVLLRFLRLPENMRMLRERSRSHDAAVEGRPHPLHAEQ